MFSIFVLQLLKNFKMYLHSFDLDRKKKHFAFLNPTTFCSVKLNSSSRLEMMTNWHLEKSYSIPANTAIEDSRRFLGFQAVAVGASYDHQIVIVRIHQCRTKASPNPANDKPYHAVITYFEHGHHYEKIFTNLSRISKDILYFFLTLWFTNFW